MRLLWERGRPNAERVRQFILEKQLEIPLIEVDLAAETHPAWWIDPTPIMAPPILELDDGTRVTETMAICAYLEELYPEPALLGTNPRDQALVRMWQRRTDWRLLRFVCEAIVALAPEDHPLCDPEHVMRVPAWGRTARKLAEAYLDVLERALSDHPYLVGNSLTMADLAAYSAIVLGEHIGLTPQEAHPALNRWFAEISSRPSTRA
jgi:glutathione S-transferase